MNLDTSYKSYIETLKKEIAQARVKAHLAVNRELILLYWKIGKHILEMQEREGWGAKVIEHVSQDLRKEFPEMKGLSTTSLKYMRVFAARISANEISPQAVDQIPWGHLRTLIDAFSNKEIIFWYAQKTIENGWSRNVLVHQIESDLYSRQGSAVTNFKIPFPHPNLI